MPESWSPSYVTEGMVPCAVCPECRSSVSRFTNPPTLFDVDFPLDSNEIGHWECLFCGYSVKPVVWDFSRFFGVPTRIVPQEATEVATYTGQKMMF